MATLKADLGPDYVQSLERGLAVLRCFSGERPSLTLSEVAEAIGLTRATARRLLLTLAGLGYVRLDGRAFSLTPQVLCLGYAYLSSLGIGDLAQGPMKALVDQVQESSSASVLDGDDIVYVARVPTSRLMTVSAGLGTRLPAHPTSMGRVLLAGLDEDRLDEYLRRVRLVALTPHTITDKDKLRAAVARARDQGWSLVDQEFELGVRSVAAPLRDRAGTTVAALNIYATPGRVSAADLRRHTLPLVRATAEEISGLLKHR